LSLRNTCIFEKQNIKLIIKAHILKLLLNILVAEKHLYIWETKHKIDYLILKAHIRKLLLAIHIAEKHVYIWETIKDWFKFSKKRTELKFPLFKIHLNYILTIRKQLHPPTIYLIEQIVTRWWLNIVNGAILLSDPKEKVTERCFPP